VSPAHRLLALAEEEHGLVVAERFDDLSELHDRRDAALAALPGRLSTDDERQLRLAAALQHRVTGALAQALADTGAEIARLSRGRGAVRGYGAGTSAPPRGALDLTG